MANWCRLPMGGIRQAACDAFFSFSPEEKEELQYFLRSLRTPSSVGTDLDKAMRIEGVRLRTEMGQME